MERRAEKGNQNAGGQEVKSGNSDSARPFLEHARHSLMAHHLPRITRSLSLLSDEQIWWRPNRASNSVGNLVLHLAGNVRQWITSGLGGATDVRQRDREFAERGPVPRRALLRRLRNAVADACQVLAELSSADLARLYSIQGFRVSGLEAVAHVMEHFAYHTGQIIFVTKLKTRKDLSFTRLPAEKKNSRAAKALPAI